MVWTILRKYWKEILIIVLIVGAYLYVNNLRDTVEDQKKEIVELKAVQKENEATITVLKLQADQIKKVEENSQRVERMLNGLPDRVKEKMNDADIKARNHCLWMYFRDGVLPKGCD